jgi:hypothetical protein
MRKYIIHTIKLINLHRILAKDPVLQMTYENKDDICVDLHISIV